MVCVKFAVVTMYISVAGLNVKSVWSGIIMIVRDWMTQIIYVDLLVLIARTVADGSVIFRTLSL